MSTTDQARVPVGRILRLAVFRMHSEIARFPSLARLYIGMMSAMSRKLPVRRAREAIEWAITGQHVHWPVLEYRSRQVLVGRSTLIRLVPHSGEFDQAVLFRSRIDYEFPVFRWLEENAVHRYDAVIEIGANIGIFSVFLDRLIEQSPGCRLSAVYSFEPSSEAYRRLCQNLTENRAKHVHAFNVAVAEKTGFVDFFEPKGHLTNGSLLEDFAGIFDNEPLRRKAVSLCGEELEQLFLAHKRILLKMDVEGYEPRLLTALTRCISEYRPDIMIEVLPQTASDIERLESLRAYHRYLLTEVRPEKHDRIFADPTHRDWILSASDIGR